MQFPIVVGLRRSFILLSAVVIVHPLALLVVCIPDWAITTTVFGVGLTLASAAWSWRLSRSQDVALRLRSDGGLECRFATSDAFLPAELAATAIVHPWLTVIYFQVADRKMTIVILPDSGRVEDLRRLRIWLRWRADFKAVGDREG